MDRRLQLQALLETIVPNVYFQPPGSLTYPCIVFERDNEDRKHANNSVYNYTERWSVTAIDRDPDSLIPRKIAALPMCSISRYFRAGNLNHSVFTLYF